MHKNIDRSNLKKFKKLCEKFGIDPQTYDINAYWDSGISAEENWAKIENDLRQMSGKHEINPARIEAEQKEAIEREETHFIKEQNKALTYIKDNSTPQIDQFFNIPIHLVKMLVQGYGYAVMFKGKGGIGKTFTILKTLRKEGFEFGKDFAYMRGYSTPLSLYRFLYQNKDKRCIVLDDIEGIFCDDRGKAILKSALDNTLGKRFVGYQTTSEKAENLPSLFELKAKIITCANDYPSDPDFKALMDRCIYYEFDFSYRELLKILGEIIKLPYKDLNLEQRKEIYKFILDNSNEASEEISIRTLYKIYEAYLYDQNNGREGFWQKLALEILKPDPDLMLVKELMNNGQSVKKQIEEFCEKTGKCRATYFNYKQKIEKSKSLKV